MFKNIYKKFFLLIFFLFLLALFLITFNTNLRKSTLNSVLNSYKIYLERLAKVTNLETGIDIEKPSQSTTIVIDNIEVYIPLKDLIDIDKEIERLNNQIENLNGRLNSINRKLDNQQFVSNAPEEIVAHEQNKKSRYENELKILQNNLNSLK